MKSIPSTDFWNLLFNIAWYFVSALISHRFIQGQHGFKKLSGRYFKKWQVQSTHFSERVPLLEGATYPGASDINTLPSPRILKSHLTYDIIPKSANEDNKCKYIYVARNPKDVAVSFFNFLTDLERIKGPWEFFVKLFLEGNGKFINTLDKVLISKLTLQTLIHCW